jgi:gas vesicle protein
MHAVHETWNDERMDEFAARTEANFAEVREEFRAVRVEIREQGTELRGEIREQGEQLRGEMKELGTELRGEIKAQGEQLRGEIKELGEAFRGEIEAARDHTDNGLAGLRAEMNERFTSLDRRFDTQTGALIAGFISLIVIHFVG